MRFSAVYAISFMTSGLYALGAPAAAGYDSRYPAGTPSFVRTKMWTNGGGPRCQLVSVPPLGESQSLLNAIAWPFATDGMAVGSAFSGSGNPIAAAARWNGSSWVNANAQNQSGFLWNTLEAVSAIPKTSDYWGVGLSLNDTVPYTLIERWTPSSWSVQPHPIQGWLNGVSASGPKNAWAVGYKEPSEQERPLALQWNGAKWKPVQVPSPKGATDNLLLSVAMAAPNDAFATGWALDGATGDTAPLIEHSDGKQWTISHTPPVGNFSILNSVSYVRGTKIAWAGGINGDSNSETYSALFETYDGSNWQLVAPAPNSNKIVFIYSISAVTSTDVWAAGSQKTNSSSLWTPLLEHWNGKAWKIVDSINPNPYADSGLSGVAGIRGVRESLSVGTTSGSFFAFSERCR